ncbi:hypothetical protein [Mycolicibacterium sp. XJ1819]
MVQSDGPALGQEMSDADVADQSIPVEADDDVDTWQEAARLVSARGSDANEADLIDQAIEVPLVDEGPDGEH